MNLLQTALAIVLILSSGVGASFQAAGSPTPQTDRSRELETAIELTTQVVKLYNEKKYDEALPIARKVLEVRQRLLAKNDVLIAAALINLGELGLVTRKDKEAEQVFQEALTILEAQSAQSAKTIIHLLNNLAYLRIRKHDFDHADPLLLRALALQEKELGPANPETIEAMKDYACIDIRNRAGTKAFASRETDPLKRALKGRAMCWLGGLSDGCHKTDEVQTEDVVNGKAIALMPPPYPTAAREKHLSGTIFIAVLIDANGSVEAAQSVCGGVAELNAASIQAARLSKFSPTKVNGQAVKVAGLIVYNFIAQ